MKGNKQTEEKSEKDEEKMKKKHKDREREKRQVYENGRRGRRWKGRGRDVLVHKVEILPGDLE